MEMQTASVGPEDRVEIEQVGGNLELEGWSQAELQSRGDDVQIQKRAGSIMIRCSRDLMLSVPQGARLVVVGVGGSVQARNFKGSLELGLVGGDVVLRNLSGSVNLTSAIGGNIRLESVADVSMSGGKVEPGFNIGENVRRKVEQATRQAEKKIRRAEHKVLQHAQIRDHRFDAAHWKFPAAQDSSGPGQASSVVSPEERLTVLKMLREKKITSEQADKLLAALAGTDSELSFVRG